MKRAPEGKVPKSTYRICQNLQLMTKLNYAEKNLEVLVQKKKKEHYLEAERTEQRFQPLSVMEEKEIGN